MAIEAACHGERFRLLVRLDTRERPGATDEDGNWFAGTVALEVAGRDVLGPNHVAVWEPDITAFCDDLERLDQTMSGRALLGHLEDQFGLEISMTAGRGSMSGFVRASAGMTLRFEDVQLDQTFLRQTLREFTALASGLDTLG